MSLTTKEVCVCDGEGCGVEMSGSSKGWWLLDRNSFWVTFGANGEHGPAIHARPWTERAAQRGSVFHYCGLTCLYKAIDKLAQKILKESAVKA